MPLNPQDARRASEPADDRRTVVALISATLISGVVLALLAIFDVK